MGPGGMIPDKKLRMNFIRSDPGCFSDPVLSLRSDPDPGQLHPDPQQNKAVIISDY